MDYKELADFISTIPNQENLSDEELAIHLNSDAGFRVSDSPIFIKIRTLYNDPLFGPERTEYIISKLKTLLPSPVIERILGWLDSLDDNGGIDIAAQSTRSFLSGLTGVLDQKEIDDLKSLGMIPTTIGGLFGFDTVYPGHIGKARMILCQM